MTVRRRGRPRKPAGTITASQLFRDAKICAVYDRVRARVKKHDSALTAIVEEIKSQNRNIAISESIVKRALAAWRPRGANCVVLFEERELVTEEELRHRAWLREEVAKHRAGAGPKLEDLPPIHPKTVVLSIRFGKRPVHPRSNRKSDHE